MEARRIVLVDDDDIVREGIEMILEGAGHRIRSTSSGQQALRWLEDEPCDLLIADFNMPELDGPQLYRRVLAQWPTSAPPIMFVSGYAEVKGYDDDPEVLAVPLLIKPFSVNDLFAAVNQVLETSDPCRVLIPTPRQN